MPEENAVTVAAGSLHLEDATIRLPHRWTEGGVEVRTTFTGAHLLHLAVAGCVLNDLFREAEALGVPLDGAEVTATGGFDTATWASTGVDYAVRLSGPSPTDAARLLAAVDAVAEIPRALRQGAPVRRADGLGVTPPATPRAPRA
ncbi:OsmC family protein [Cellulomonas sp. C5510]|nr:OsmC family protein [Cellulomonas sp. C5510]